MRDKRKGKAMTKKLLGLLALAAVFAVGAIPAAADTMGLSCTGTTVCNSGSFNDSIAQTASPTFELTNTGSSLSGTAFLAVLVPNGTASFTLTNNGSPVALEESLSWSGTPDKLAGLLGEVQANGNSGLTTFSSQQSGSAQANVTASSFTVYEFNLGAYSTGSPLTDLAVGPLPAGTNLFAWVENSSGAEIDQVSNSKSITVDAVKVPEASTALLLSLALLSVVGVAKLSTRQICATN